MSTSETQTTVKQLIRDIENLCANKMKKNVQVIYIDQQNIEFPIIDWTSCYDIYLNTKQEVTGRFDLVEKKKRNLIATFKLSLLPSCSYIMLSTGAYVDGRFRGMGLGNLLCKFREAVCQALDMQMIMCTVSPHNTVQKRIMERRGWKLCNPTDVTVLAPMVYIKSLFEKKIV